MWDALGSGASGSPLPRVLERVKEALVGVVLGQERKEPFALSPGDGKTWSSRRCGIWCTGDLVLGSWAPTVVRTSGTRVMGSSCAGVMGTSGTGEIGTIGTEDWQCWGDGNQWYCHWDWQFQHDGDSSARGMGTGGAG